MMLRGVVVLGLWLRERKTEKLLSAQREVVEIVVG